MVTARMKNETPKNKTKNPHKDTLTKAINNGVIAVLILILVNLTVLSFLNFPAMAVLQIKKYWLLLLILIGGFGFQIGLYTYLKYRNAVCSFTTMTSGGVSSVSMLLCCSHYLLPILPFLSVTFSFLTKYTPYILLFGIFSSAVGIFFMLKKAEVHVNDKIKFRRNIVLVLFAVILISSVFAQYAFYEDSLGDYAKLNSINGNSVNDYAAQKTALQSDKCKAPYGYTQEKWNEHMGHHPEMYKECL